MSQNSGERELYDLKKDFRITFSPSETTRQVRLEKNRRTETSKISSLMDMKGIELKLMRNLKKDNISGTCLT